MSMETRKEEEKKPSQVDETRAELEGYGESSRTLREEMSSSQHKRWVSSPGTEKAP